MIKAIETIYNNHKFRSRLEARWAVFFDTLGVKWEYEFEGFKIDGICYLVDFWLPDIHWFVEIKPTAEISQADRKKIKLLDDNSMNLPLPYQSWGVIVLIGTPDLLMANRNTNTWNNTGMFMAMTEVGVKDSIIDFGLYKKAVISAVQARF